MSELITVSASQMQFCQSGLEIKSIPEFPYEGNGKILKCVDGKDVLLYEDDEYWGEINANKFEVDSKEFAASVLATIEIFFNNDVVKCKKLKTAGVGILCGNSNIPIWIIPDPRPDLTEYEYREIEGEWVLV